MYVPAGLSKSLSRSRRQTACGARYSIVPEDMYHPDLGEYRTYGIQITDIDYVEILHDVSACENTVKHIIELINGSPLSPIHLCDVVWDMIP